MLNFCPDLFREPLELHKATRELLFLVDRSGSMSGTNISRVKVGWIKTTFGQEFLDLGACIEKTPSCLLLFVFPTGSHGGGAEESPFRHHAQHRRLRHDHQAPVHLQQALH